ncbi:MAG: hypothetical protein Q8O63_07440 [Hoeflea sp.]|nr:hypothetical protein [Hoeflea sp.]
MTNMISEAKTQQAAWAALEARETSYTEEQARPNQRMLDAAAARVDHFKTNIQDSGRGYSGRANSYIIEVLAQAGNVVGVVSDDEGPMVMTTEGPVGFVDALRRRLVRINPTY